MGSELYIHSGGRSSSHLEAIKTYSLELLSGFVLQLEKTYVPSFSRIDLCLSTCTLKEIL